MPPFVARTVRLDGWRLYLILTLIAAAFLTPGIARLPAVDRDEARFMQATKQMVESGDYAHIRFQNEPRDKKPPGAYWLQAASVRWLAGGPTTERWPYRVPSVLGVLLAVLVTAAAARHLSDSRGGFAAGAMVVSAPIVVIEGHLAKADAPLLGMSAVCFAVVCLAYSRRAVAPFALITFWLALGASVAIKGPVLAAVCALAIGVLAIADRQADWLWRLRPLIGLPLAASAMIAWIQVSGLGEVTRFSQAALLQDLLPKLSGGMESHGAPPGSHLVAALATLWPWSALLPLAAAAWRQRHRLETRFCLAWIVPFWIFLELIPTKLPHYILPAIPAIAVLLALSWSRPSISQGTPSVLAAWASRFALMIFPIALGVALLGGINSGVLVMSAALIAAVILPFAAVVVAWRAPDIPMQIPRLLVITIVIFAALLQWTLPQAQSLNIAGALATKLQPGQRIALAGFHEPSAVFALGTDTFLTDAAGVANFILSRPDAVGVIAADDIEAVERQVEGAARKPLRLDQVSGYNYGHGHAVDLIIVKAAP